eukprot:SAG25_NODE_12672_length_276_cov_2.293785_1_plen_37_part_10
MAQLYGSAAEPEGSIHLDRSAAGPLGSGSAELSRDVP